MARAHYMRQCPRLYSTQPPLTVVSRHSKRPVEAVTRIPQLCSGLRRLCTEPVRLLLLSPPRDLAELVHEIQLGADRDHAR